MATEKRLIDADEVLEVICNYCPDDIQCPVGGCAEFQRIHKLLTANAVEVVRCKDCKHWSYISGLDKEPHCTVFCGLNSKAYPTDPDDYCSKGERKDNGAE